jgi:hypothetical protein
MEGVSSRMDLRVGDWGLLLYARKQIHVCIRQCCAARKPCVAWTFGICGCQPGPHAGPPGGVQAEYVFHFGLDPSQEAGMWGD